MAASFLWYDLETFGRDPRRTRIAQFAAIRTDETLNPVGDPIRLFCQPADDLLPSPEATLITGITPQQALARRPARGRILRPRARATIAAEHLRRRLQLDPLRRRVRPLRPVPQFPRRLRARMAQRQFALGPARRDAADACPASGRHAVAAARGRRCRASSSSTWPRPTASARATAHEALSDVRALIGLARKLRQAQPKLWDYALRLRDKRHAGEPARYGGDMTPVLHISAHVSGRAPLRRAGHAARPASAHRLAGDRLRPGRRSRPLVVAVGGGDRGPALHARRGPAGRRAARSAQGSAQQQMPGAVAAGAPARGRPGTAGHRPARLPGTTRSDCASAPGLAEKVRRVFASENHREPADADAALYDGFVADGDKRLFPKVRSSKPSELGALESELKDPRLSGAAVPLPRAQLAADAGRRRAAALGRLPPAAPGQRQRPVGIPLRRPTTTRSPRCARSTARARRRPCSTRSRPGAARSNPASADDQRSQRMATPYFTEKTFKFLRALARNNSREWFHEHKAEYDAHLRGPFLQLITDLQPDLLGNQRALPRRPEGRRRLAVPHPSRHPLLQRQDAVQDLVGRALLPCPPQAGRRAVVLPAHPARQLLRRRRPVASRAGHAAQDPPVHRRQSRRLEGRGHRRPHSSASSAWTASRWCGRRAAFPADHELIDDIKRKNFVAMAPLEDAVVLGRHCERRWRPVRALAPLVDYLCAALDLEF